MSTRFLVVHILVITCALGITCCFGFINKAIRPYVRHESAKQSRELRKYVGTSRVDEKPLECTTNEGDQSGSGPSRSQAELKVDIDGIFPERDKIQWDDCNEILFTNFVNDGLQYCNVSNTARFARFSGRKLRPRSNALFRQYLPNFASKIRALSSSLWSFLDITFVIYGLQDLEPKDDGYLDIVSSMTMIIGKALKGDDVVTSQGLSIMLYGLQLNACDDDESIELLKTITQMVIKCTEAFEAQKIGNMLYGLQKMSSDSDEVRALISALTAKMRSGQEPLDGQAVGNALYGLQSMSSDSAEVCALISALTPRIQSCKQLLIGQAVGNALYGLQGMSSDSAEVRALLSALVPKVLSCKDEPRAQAVGNALYGLRGMSSDSAEVCALISALVPYALCCKEPLDGQAVGNALYGIIGLKETPAFAEIMNKIQMSMVELASSSAQLKSISDVESVVCLAQSIALSLPVLQSIVSDDDFMKWERASKLLDDDLASRPGLSGGGFRSAAERRVYKVSAKALEKSEVLLSSNEHLFNLFESDIVLRIPRVGGDCLIVNIEVDGMHHLREKSKRFCVLRDEYLKSRGVVVERLTVSRLMEMYDYDVEQWVLEKVAAASSPSAI